MVMLNQQHNKVKAHPKQVRNSLPDSPRASPPVHGFYSKQMKVKKTSGVNTTRGKTAREKLTGLRKSCDVSQTPRSSSTVSSIIRTPISEKRQQGQQQRRQARMRQASKQVTTEPSVASSSQTSLPKQPPVLQQQALGPNQTLVLLQTPNQGLPSARLQTTAQRLPSTRPVRPNATTTIMLSQSPIQGSPLLRSHANQAHHQMPSPQQAPISQSQQVKRYEGLPQSQPQLMMSPDQTWQYAQPQQWLLTQQEAETRFRAQMLRMELQQLQRQQMQDQHITLQQFPDQQPQAHHIQDQQMQSFNPEQQNTFPSGGTMNLPTIQATAPFMRTPQICEGQGTVQYDPRIQFTSPANSHLIVGSRDQVSQTERGAPSLLERGVEEMGWVEGEGMYGDGEWGGAVSGRGGDLGGWRMG